MKYKVYLILAIALLFGCVSVQAQASDAVTDIESMWLEHNVFYGNAKGLMIHTSFSIENMKGRSIQVVAYFFYEDGTPVKGYYVPAQYRSMAGELCSGSQAYVKYESTTWEDYKLFFPYGFLQDGNYSCVVQISAGNVLLAVSDPAYFTQHS